MSYPIRTNLRVCKLWKHFIWPVTSLPHRKTRHLSGWTTGFTLNYSVREEALLSRRHEMEKLAMGTTRDACGRKKGGRQKHASPGRSKDLLERPAKQHTPLPASPAALQVLLAFLFPCCFVEACRLGPHSVPPWPHFHLCVPALILLFSFTPPEILTT